LSITSSGVCICTCICLSVYLYIYIYSHFPLQNVVANHWVEGAN
jgi:hypothetical protein